MCLSARQFWLGGLAVLAVAVSILGGLRTADAGPAVTGARIGDSPAKTRFVIDLDGPVKFDVFVLADPYRVVIDLPEVDWRIDTRKRPSSNVISGFRWGLFKPGNARMVLDVTRPVAIAKSFLLDPGAKRGHRLVIDLKPVSRDAFMAAQRKAEPAPPPPAPAQAAMRVPDPAPQDHDRRRLIAIDPGHGGVDPGAQGVSGGHEKEITLAVARELGRQLKATGRYRVVMTRDRDVFVQLRQRIRIAQRAGAHLFISLHADSIGNRRVRGGSVYTLSERASDKEAAALAAKENRADLIAGIDLTDQSQTVARILIDLRQRLTMNESAVFAKGLVGELGRSTRMLRNTHRFAGFAVLKAPAIPSVLVEMGYLSNPTDEKLLRNANHRRVIAGSVVRAVDRFFSRQQAYSQP
jgi:N-acetylmuramoyl-L-alanine amidase